MKFSGRVLASARPVIGSVEVLEPKMASVSHGRFRLLGDLGLHGAVFEHRLDDEIGVVQRAKIGRWGGCATSTSAFFSGVARPREMSRSSSLPNGPCPPGARSSRGVDQRHVDAGLRRDIGDARAHHAGAEHAEAFHFGRRFLRGRRAPLPSSCIEWNSVRIMLRLVGVDQDANEIARLDLERGVDIDEQALIDRRHDEALGRDNCR